MQIQTVNEVLIDERGNVDAVKEIDDRIAGFIDGSVGRCRTGNGIEHLLCNGVKVCILPFFFADCAVSVHIPPIADIAERLSFLDYGKDRVGKREVDHIPKDVHIPCVHTGAERFVFAFGETVKRSGEEIEVIQIHGLTFQPMQFAPRRIDVDDTEGRIGNVRYIAFALCFLHCGLTAGQVQNRKLSVSCNRHLHLISPIPSVCGFSIVSFSFAIAHAGSFSSSAIP